jgi:ATP-binding protein involved in chromosome partitioning
MSSDVFGSGGGDRLAAELQVPLLGRVPLDARVRASADDGMPLVLCDPDCEPAVEITRIAEAIDASRVGGFTRTLPLVS